ncbi:MAG: hypothetical protein IPM45_18030 [Acidimicrobiales bacterium]|nr:hypothetical protein [Acidimicrobiales bacterium]
MATVHVPQADGEIRITVGGPPPAVYPVHAHHVDVPDGQLDVFLTTVEGARLDSDAPSGGPTAPSGGGPDTTPESQED